MNWNTLILIIRSNSGFVWWEISVACCGNNVQLSKDSKVEWMESRERVVTSSVVNPAPSCGGGLTGHHTRTSLGITCESLPHLLSLNPTALSYIIDFIFSHIWVNDRGGERELAGTFQYWREIYCNGRNLINFFWHGVRSGINGRHTSIHCNPVLWLYIGIPAERPIPHRKIWKRYTSIDWWDGPGRV